MASKIIHAFYGKGKGKTSAAIGQALRGVGDGESVTIIQFLKGKSGDEFHILERLEPDVKLFRFDQSDSYYSDLSDSDKEREKQNIINGFNFAKKIVETGESEYIVFDELLGVLDLGIISFSDVLDILQIEGSYKKLYITGSNLASELEPYIDVISEIELKKDNI